MSTIGIVTVVPAAPVSDSIMGVVAQTTILYNIIIVVLVAIWIIVVVYIMNEALVLSGRLDENIMKTDKLIEAIEKLNRVMEVGDRWAFIKLCDIAIRHFHDHDSITFSEE
jgi:hypothetical protein